MSDQLNEMVEPELVFEYPLDPAKPLVLLLGWVDHEGIVSSIKSTGGQYKKKLLDSKPENWESIVKLFEQYKISCVLGKLPPYVFTLLLETEYRVVRDRLFPLVGSVPNQMYIYEDLLVGEMKDELDDEYYQYPPRNVVEAALDFLRSHRIELVPYKRKSDVTVLAESFLDDTERNLIFRLYVPNGRLWSSEADKFLQLFQDYLAKVDRLAVRLDQKRTDYGTIYEFHGEPPQGEHDLSSEFKDFSELMDLCATNSEVAASLLASKKLDTREVTRILEKYSKEARRLQLDIKHEAESKAVSIRHRLEAELIELDPTPDDWRVFSSLVENAVPVFSHKLPSPSYSMSGMAQLSKPATNVTYYIRPQFINTVNGIVAEEIHGNQHFEPEHHQLLEAVKVHGGSKSKELETAVYEIADKSVEQVNHLKAQQKLKGFLIEIGKKTGDMAFSILQKYLENKIGL